VAARATARRATGAPAPAHLRRLRLELRDGSWTTVHAAVYDSARTQVHVRKLRRPEPLASWCARTGVAEAIIGGFFVRPDGIPLGDLRTHGIARGAVPFTAPWDRLRACVHAGPGGLAITGRAELPAQPRGDLLQAGPLLVRDGLAAVHDGEDPEGFSAASGQFDSDITQGRHPRAALALGERQIFAVAVDGRTVGEAGLTLGELAEVLVALGAQSALNLDGGGSTSLVCAGELRNRPREASGEPIPAGRPVPTALVFEPRS
jgi:hypothetical protein